MRILFILNILFYTPCLHLHSNLHLFYTKDEGNATRAKDTIFNIFLIVGTIFLVYFL